MIRLTELSRKGDKLQPATIMIAPHAIYVIQEAIIQKQQIAILGESNDVPVRAITLRNGQNLFVRDTMQEIELAIQAHDAGN